jgi:hypothetical protein
MPTDIWTWCLIFMLSGQRAMLIPYYDTEELCNAAMVQMVSDHPTALVDCAPLLKPEKPPKPVRKPHHYTHAKH